MSNEVLHKIKGSFVGNFFTTQADILKGFDKDKSVVPYEIKIFEGQIDNVELINTENLEIKKGDISLKNVDNIQIVPSGNWPIKNKRIFSLGEFVLTDVEVVSSWFKNNKTYGILKGNISAIVLKNRIIQNKQEDDFVKELPNTDANDKPEDNPVNREKEKPEDSGDANTKDEDLKTEEGSSNDQTKVQNDGTNRMGCTNLFSNAGCGNFYSGSGCFRWILFVLFLLLLFLIFRECNGKGTGYNCLQEWLKKKMELEEQKKTIDSLDNKLEDLKIEKKTCSLEEYQGTNQTILNHYNLGDTSGTVSIDYDTRFIPDLIEVFYDGSVVATTNDYVSGKGLLSFFYKYELNKPDYFSIKVTPSDNPDTRWSYIVNCPKK